MEVQGKKKKRFFSFNFFFQGLKYVVHGILFKFCLAGMSENDLFGSDANAMKTAGNELKALVSIFNAGVGSGNCENAEIRNLRLPLMCLVDFRGANVHCCACAFF